MHKLGNTLLILIATMLVADPVMACCLTGSQPADSGATQTETPPCHGKKSLTADTEQSITSPAVFDLSAQSCPGCGDCATSMAAVDHQSQYFVATTATDSDEPEPQDLTARASSWARHALDPPIPSEPPLRPFDTLQSLNQLLLI